MNFGGFQKLTLLDYPGVLACTVFTKGCNFLCPFCHNASLVNRVDPSSSFSDEEILTFLRKRQGILEGVCITGGEPLLHSPLIDFIREVKALGYRVKLDTNGSRPEYLENLIEQKLVDYVAMDIKNSKEKYAMTAGVEALDLGAIEKSVEVLLLGKVDFEFRTTVVKELHEVGDIEKIGEWIKGAPRYFLQGFVDSGNLISTGFSAHSREEMEKMCLAAAIFVANVEIRGIL